MRCEIFTESYRGYPVRTFWIRPSTPGPLNYGYRIEAIDLEIESVGFLNTAIACRHAAKVIDDLIAEVGIPNRLFQTDFFRQ